MPRPANPNAPKIPTTPEEAIAQGRIDMSDVPEDRAHDDLVAAKINQAADLLDEKKALLAKIGEVRELLTLLTNTGTGSYEQVAWVRFNLPRKTRKDSGEETEGFENGAEVDEQEQELEEATA